MASKILALALGQGAITVVNADLRPLQVPPYQRPLGFSNQSPPCRVWGTTSKTAGCIPLLYCEKLGRMTPKGHQPTGCARAMAPLRSAS